ncbi:MAG: hypothetical protein KGZ58_04990 [Ignavibacteriales bacterium]|nr:hypothetical protein [Ignavibacteriales bacterium]
MTNTDYIPRTNAEFVVWLNNVVNKVPNHAATLGITNDQITQLQNDLQESTAKLNELNGLKATLQSLTQIKNEVFRKARKHARDIGILSKRSEAFTDAIGEDLGIIPPKPPLAKGDDEIKPEFVATVLTDGIRIDWTKDRYSGVVIQSRRGAETENATLDKDTQPPYEDKRKNLAPNVPEARYYRIRYLDGDVEIGNWSDEVRVVCLI